MHSCGGISLSIKTSHLLRNSSNGKYRPRQTYRAHRTPTWVTDGRVLRLERHRTVAFSHQLPVFTNYRFHDSRSTRRLATSQSTERLSAHSRRWHKGNMYQNKPLDTCYIGAKSFRKQLRLSCTRQQFSCTRQQFKGTNLVRQGEHITTFIIIALTKRLRISCCHDLSTPPSNPPSPPSSGAGSCVFPGDTWVGMVREHKARGARGGGHLQCVTSRIRQQRRASTYKTTVRPVHLLAARAIVSCTMHHYTQQL